MEEIDSEIINEFVIESSENLARLDREMVELERCPTDALLLASIFRTIHTIKDTCGFLGFHMLERVTHHAENILSQVRDGERKLSPELVSLILETVDAVKAELTSIEATSAESGEEYTDLLQRQEAAAEGKVSPSVAATPRKDSQDEEPQKVISAADSTIRVDVALLDRLMNLVGELVLARNQVLQFSAVQDDAGLNATSQRLKSDHHGIAGQCHENPHAANRHDLEQVAAGGAGLSDCLRQADQSGDGRRRHRIGQDYH